MNATGALGITFAVLFVVIATYVIVTWVTVSKTKPCPASGGSIECPSCDKSSGSVNDSFTPIDSQFTPIDVPASVARVEQSQSARKIEQAFSGDTPDMIKTRQDGDKFQIQAILPNNTPCAENDRAGKLMDMYIPSKEKLLNVTQAVGSNRMALFNTRSPKGRIVGTGNLLRPAPPMPACSSDPTFLDSDMRHYARQTNIPPVAGPGCVQA